ncbi:MAG: hypothetical protein J5601_06000 [Elusimicrobiaceae bacterium]|nr:hypothetical protein [Elusimicrobiaceae bacterium]
MKTIYIAQAQDLSFLSEPILAILAKNRVAKVEIKSATSKTNPQLGYYHGVILPCIQRKFIEDGNDTWSLDDIDQFLKAMFFYEEKEINGQLIKITKSLASASIEEFAEYLTDVIRWCHENQIFIPAPMR